MYFRRVLIALVLLCVAAVAARAFAQTGAGQAVPIQAEPAPVVVLNVKGAIGVGTGHMIEEGFARARAERAGLIVLRLDTPGGLVSATRDIIQAILASPISGPQHLFKWVLRVRRRRRQNGARMASLPRAERRPRAVQWNARC